MYNNVKDAMPHEKIKDEVARLFAAFQTSARPIPPAVVCGKDFDFGTIWEIPLANGQNAYVSQRSYGHPDNDESNYIVHVDAEKFYAHWLNTALGPIQSECILQEDMPQDYKFNQAVDGFSHGKENPVPLAEVSAFEFEGTPVITLQNGVTRLFYLLSQGAKTFPVAAYGRGNAEKLNKIAGIENCTPIPDWAYSH